MTKTAPKTEFKTPFGEFEVIISASGMISIDKVNEVSGELHNVWHNPSVYEYVDKNNIKSLTTLGLLYYLHDNGII
jgi:hypothetical protein